MKKDENLVILPYILNILQLHHKLLQMRFIDTYEYRWQPSLKMKISITDPLYIDALVNSINSKIKINWKPDLILVYHGIPKYFDKGDPYHCYCHKIIRLISKV